MSQTIKLKRSSVVGKVPTTGNLDLGEIALNTNDGKVFFKKDDGSESIQTILTTNSLTTGSVTISGSIISSDVSSSYIDLDVLANGDIPPHKEGRIFYGAEDGALEVYNDEADITLQVGQEFWIRVYNDSGNSILNGTPVRVSGSQGDRLKIFPATAQDHTTDGGVSFKNHIAGIATHDIEDSTEGYITAQGIVRGIDTSLFVAGDVLYLQTGSPVQPEDYYRNTPPPFPYDIIQAGYVARSQNNGFIFSEPKEPVHFGNISGLSGSSASTGDLWVYQSNDAWTPTNVLPNIEASGSFSGSFVGDGSGLTGITAEGTVSQSGQVDHDQTLNFVSNEHIDHSGVSIVAGSGLTGGGNITTSRTINVGAGDGITVNANDIQVDGTVLRTTGDSVVSSSVQIDHDQTTNFSSDEHFTQSNITTVGTVTVGDITGILPSGTVSASAQLTNTFLEITGDSVVSSSTQISHDSTSGFVSDEHINHTSVSISAGSGLTGGGNITTSRTINVGAGDGISVSADEVTVDSTVVRTSGDQTIGGLKIFSSNISGSGDFTIRKNQPTIRLVDDNTATSNFPRIILDTLNNQGVMLYHDEFDTFLPESGYGLVLGPSPNNTQFPSTGDLTFQVLGSIYADTETTGSGYKVLTTNDGLSKTGDSVVSSSAQISHDSTTGFVSNEHIDHSSVSISSGNGLNGGGDLTSTRTLSVGQGDGITVGTGTVAVDSTVVRTSGDQTIGGNKTFSNNVLVNGNTTIGNASGDSFTVKTGTITLNQSAAAADTIINNTNAASDLVLKTSGGRVRVDDDLEVTSSVFVDFGGGGSSNYFEIKTNQLFAGTTFNLAGTTTSENVFNFTRDDTVLVTISGSGQLSVGQLPQDGYMLAVNGKSFFNDDVNINSGQLLIGGNTLGFQSNLDVDTGTEVVATISSSDFDGAFFDVIIKNGTNLRASQIMAVHDGTSVEFSETSTNDLGDTTDVTLSVDLSGGNIRLLATTTSDNWRVSAYVRGM